MNIFWNRFVLPPKFIAVVPPIYTVANDVQAWNILPHALFPLIVVKADRLALISPVQPANIELHALLAVSVVKAGKSALVSPVQT